MMAARSDEDQAAPATVLVVEDELLIRMDIADYLRERGYHVVEAGSGDEAVVALKADIGIAVVFTDVSMPGSLDGLGLARWVHRERPGLGVILTSGVARIAPEVQDLLTNGPLMAKPYDHGEVEARIRTALAHR
jgi:DNA-binding NtrC family response regulator